MKTVVRLTSIVLVFAARGVRRHRGDRNLGPLETESGISFERNTSFDGEVLRIELPREDGGDGEIQLGQGRVVQLVLGSVHSQSRGTALGAHQGRKRPHFSPPTRW